MITLKQFLTEDFRRDNPGGDWLKHSQKAAEDYGQKYPSAKSMTRGSLTGYFKKNLKIPTEHLHKMKGATGEHHFRDHGLPGHVNKLHELEKEVGHPSNFDTKKHPIMVGINHHGEPHIMEGNHRVAYAKKHGISHVHAEVRYYNGGEDVKGSAHPDHMKQYETE